MSPVQPNLWKTSPWLRVYDWDWRENRPATMTEHAAGIRAEALPGRFYYHALRVVTDEVAPDGSDAFRVDHVEITDLTRAALEAGREPRSIAAIIDAAHGTSGATRGTMLSVVQALIGAGLIVAAEDEEPIVPGAVFSAARTLYGCFQHPGEIAAAILAVHGLRPKTVLEIGTAWGGSLFCWAQAADPEALLISVDLPGGDGGGGYSPEFVPHFRNFLFDGQTLSSILGDSHSPAMLNEVVNTLGGRQVDFLFIDGDHSYEGVKTDFALYSPLVAAGGMIMFHDTRPRTSPDPITPIEVPRFWDEVKDDYRHQEFVGEPIRDGMGIGVLYVV